jgi:DNA-binding beta-propeller fold protein YncE
MTPDRLILATIVSAVLWPPLLSAQAASCRATSGSMTPSGWHAPLPNASATGAVGTLHVVHEYPLPGAPNRFDYQSLDPTSGHLYLSHMNAGSLVVFDLAAGRVLAEVGDLPRATGVLAVPGLHKIFVSAAGNHEVAVVDDRTLAVTARVGGIRFPDGIAYVPDVGKVFVSDESGAADAVIDAVTNAARGRIALGGEAGNTQYDSVSHCILVAVQTRNQLVAIDPVTEQIVARYDLPGADHPHGFTIDQPGRLAFISCEGNAKLLVLDLRTMRVIATHAVGSGPDVLAWDAGWRRLYVASEGGLLSAFQADGATLHPVGEYRAPHAHTVSVDPRTHRIYLPLEDIAGKPVLRVLEAIKP